VFITSEITKLLDQKLISNVSYLPPVVHPITVAQDRSDKQDLILDCRTAN